MATFTATRPSDRRAYDFPAGNEMMSTRSLLNRRLLSTGRWLAVLALLALLAACGGGDPEPASTPAAGSGNTTASAFQVLPAAASLAIGEQVSLLSLQTAGTPVWASSDPAVASVTADGQVTALAKGIALITATVGTDQASSSIKVYRGSGPNPDPTSNTLITQALAQGTISAEQALTYRVYALFGDARLPAAFDGAPGVPNHMLLREVAAQMATLSPATQSLLQAFLLPPIYVESAHAQSLALPPGVADRARAQAYAARPRPLEINCNVAAGPSAYRRVSATTADAKFTFNVFYFPLHGVGVDPQAAIAQQIAAAAVEAYRIETGLLDRFPLADAGLPCNGGDGGIDIYLVPLNNLRLAGQTVPYGISCANSPSFVVLNLNYPIFYTSVIQPGKDDTTGAVQSVVAHELMHVLQLAMPRQASCSDTKWFDEATAEWAMDLVVPKIPQSQAAAPGLEDGFPRVGGQLRSGGFLAEYLYIDHLRPLEKGLPESLGYPSYLFFQYLARSQTPQSVRQVFDAMAGGMNSVEAIGRAIDMTAVWPEFAKSLWNDYQNKVLDFWSQEDGYDYGLADVFASPAKLEGATADLKPLEIDRKGKPDQIFPLLHNALLASASGDYEIPPRTMIYEHLKFTDATVHSVAFFNPIADTPNNQYMKLQVVRKIGGAWKPAEDWTHEAFKSFCLDQKDERIEELLVIVSNSEINRSTEQPFRIYQGAPMQVSTSNVGCWRFTGSATTTTTSPGGLITVETATGVRFDRFQNKPPLDLVDAGISLGYDLFTPAAAGSVTYSISGFDRDSGCSVSANATAAVQGVNDGEMIANFGLPLPLYRIVIGDGASPILAVPVTYTCPQSIETLSLDKRVHWLLLPDPGATISADGQTISGRWDRVDQDGAKSTVWDFRALREP